MIGQLKDLVFFFLFRFGWAGEDMVIETVNSSNKMKTTDAHARFGCSDSVCREYVWCALRTDKWRTELYMLVLVY